MKKKLVTYRLTTELIDAMREQAVRENRSLTNLVEYYMRRACLDPRPDSTEREPHESTNRRAAKNDR